jgi:hypothetical protein
MSRFSSSTSISRQITRSSHTALGSSAVLLGGRAMSVVSDHQVLASSDQFLLFLLVADSSSSSASQDSTRYRTTRRSSPSSRPRPPNAPFQPSPLLFFPSVSSLCPFLPLPNNGEDEPLPASPASFHPVFRAGLQRTNSKGWLRTSSFSLRFRFRDGLAHRSRDSPTAYKLTIKTEFPSTFSGVVEISYVLRLPPFLLSRSPSPCQQPRPP